MPVYTEGRPLAINLMPGGTIKSDLGQALFQYLPTTRPHPMPPLVDFDGCIWL
jgi:hypothetical protein